MTETRNLLTFKANKNIIIILFFKSILKSISYLNKFNLVQHTYLTRRNSFVNSYHIPIQCMGHGLLQKRKIF